MVTLTDEDVRARLDEIERKLQKVAVWETYLRKEREQYKTVLSVMERLGGASPTGPIESELDGLEEDPSGLSQARPESTKPADAPAMPLMIMEALLVAHEAGKDRLEPKDITQFVRDRYWPDAPTSSVGPTVWRMAKDGRLRKLGEFYALPEAPADGAEFSARGAETETAGVTDRDLAPADLF